MALLGPLCGMVRYEEAGDCARPRRARASRGRGCARGADRAAERTYIGGHLARTERGYGGGWSWPRPGKGRAWARARSRRKARAGRSCPSGAGADRGRQDYGRAGRRRLPRAKADSSGDRDAGHGPRRAGRRQGGWDGRRLAQTPRRHGREGRGRGRAGQPGGGRSEERTLLGQRQSGASADPVRARAVALG